ncbi:isochorismatase family protein [Gracilibacillus caseinilyticus]|uniref:isochorismatase n=1 Tax=Gracilibacillus caseinilyticus TaxID=2932256 RepID=A0ABY4EW73_9BACI|nr:isochorismatase family protein [Gracilibacillus caseinilyticus]UOQ48668.1 isochorismatase family protein [Gracilibacillus caseinilyticus]
MGLPTIPSYQMPSKEDLPDNCVSWEVDADRAVLLIHDMQQYFLNAYDQKQSPIPELVNNIEKLKEQCKALGIPVVYTAQPGDQDPKDRALLTDFWGGGLTDDESVTKITDTITPDEEDLVLTKWRYSAFKRTSLQSFLEATGRDQLVITGVYAHIGCLVTATEAFMEDVQSFLVADAIADFSVEKHHMALNYVATRCGVTITLEQVLQAIQQKQDDLQFTSFEGLRNRVAELLDQSPDELKGQENLLDVGLDSIRLMSVREELRQEGIDVDFVTLAENPTLNDWWTKIINYQKQSV